MSSDNLAKQIVSASDSKNDSAISSTRTLQLMLMHVCKNEPLLSDMNVKKQLKIAQRHLLKKNKRGTFCIVYDSFENAAECKPYRKLERSHSTPVEKYKLGAKR